MYMDRNVAGWLSRAGGEAAIPVRPRAGVNMLTRLMSGLRAGENTQPTWAARPAGGGKTGRGPTKVCEAPSGFEFSTQNDG